MYEEEKDNNFENNQTRTGALNSEDPLATQTEQQRLKARVKKYCQNVYKQVH